MTDNTASAIISALPQTRDIRAIIFDYGNTLIPFGRAEVDAFDTRLAVFLREHSGPFDENRYHELRERDRLAPYQGSPPQYRESDLHRMVGHLFETLYGFPPAPQVLHEIIEFRREIFVGIVNMSPDTRNLLRKLRNRFRVGLLSNYPGGEAIRRSLIKNRADALFDAVLVSGDLGLVKPHPAIFRAVTQALGVSPQHCLYVGDNWLADVQGARQAGMITLRFVRWVPPERFDPMPGDLPPHAEISNLESLFTLLPEYFPTAGDPARHG